MSTSLGIRAGSMATAPKLVHIETVVPAELPVTPIKSTFFYMSYKCSCDILWLLLSVLAGVIFMKPSDSFEAVTYLDATDVDAVAPDLTEVIMGSSSVMILLIASYLPCMWYWTTPVLRMISLVMALVYWSILISKDSFDIFEEWFSLTVLGFLAVPVFVTIIDLGMKLKKLRHS